MKIATWNVNSLKVRLEQVQCWLAESQTDVLCLQETKTEDANFPLNELQQAGYQVVFCVQYGLPNFEDVQKRVIAATVDGVRVVCVYIPNGESVDSDKYQYKLTWLAALQTWLKEEMLRYPKLVLLGDYNIAPEDRDVHDPVAWAGKVLCSEPERAVFKGLQQSSLRDAFRLFEQPEKMYSWWDYRMMGFRRNHGLRIDHILLSPAVACTACNIDKAPRKLERPSDHAPVWAEIS
jgi:exodeoxyribonuclease-3